jgi:beta-N-acetylhexosaminidase
MVGQMIIVGFRGDGTNKDSDDFIALTNQIKNNQIGGVILFDTSTSQLLKNISKADYSNIKNVAQIKELTTYLQSLSKTKLLIAIDQEGGSVQRLKPEHGFISVPSAQEMGTQSPENTYNIAYNLGIKLSEIGINTNFAPVADLGTNKDEKGRSFSDNANKVIEHAGAFARGMNDASVIHSFKHFPGYNGNTTRAHYTLVDITNTYTDYELVTWKALLQKPFELSTVMTSHSINKSIDTVPLSLSPKTITKIKNLGFNGVIITDDLDMLLRYNQYDIKTIVKMAINAGNDILLFNNRNFQYDKNRGTKINQIITEMVKSGEIPASRIKESYKKIKKLKEHIK